MTWGVMSAHVACVWRDALIGTSRPDAGADASLPVRRGLVRAASFSRGLRWRISHGMSSLLLWCCAVGPSDRGCTAVSGTSALRAGLWAFATWSRAACCWIAWREFSWVLACGDVVIRLRAHRGALLPRAPPCCVGGRTRFGVQRYHLHAIDRRAPPVGLGCLCHARGMTHSVHRLRRRSSAHPPSAAQEQDLAPAVLGVPEARTISWTGFGTVSHGRSRRPCAHGPSKRASGRDLALALPPAGLHL